MPGPGPTALFLEGGAFATTQLERRCHSPGGAGARRPTPMWVEKRNERLEAELEVETRVDAHQTTPIPTPTPYLDVPVLIQVIDTCDAAPITVGIVNVPHVPQPIAWVTRHHGLAETDGSTLLGLSRHSWGTSHYLLFSVLPAPHL